jgi:hypothetical protein
MIRLQHFLLACVSSSEVITDLVALAPEYNLSIVHMTGQVHTALIKFCCVITGWQENPAKLHMQCNR